MDTATVKAIVSKETRSLRQEIKKLKGEALDSASIVKAINNKNALAAKLQQHIGAFDHQSMTSEHEIATYGIKKLGIACDAGEELATLKGYIAAKTPTNIVVDSTAKDGKADFKLEDVGL